MFRTGLANYSISCGNRFDICAKNGWDFSKRFSDECQYLDAYVERGTNVVALDDTNNLRYSDLSVRYQRNR